MMGIATLNPSYSLLSPERGQLTEWQGRIKQYLRDELRLELNDKHTRLRPVSDGIDFVGYIARREYLLVRRRVVSKLKLKLSEYRKELVREGRYFRRFRFDEDLLDKLFATLCSYLGHSKMANTYKLWRSIWGRETWLGQYFKFDLDERKLTRTYKAPRWLRRTAQQYRYYRSRFRGDVLLFQVGRFFEFYDKRDADIARLLDLAPIGGNARGAHYGFPVSLASHYLHKLIRTRWPVAMILETKSYLTGVQVRLPAWRFERVHRGPTGLQQVNHKFETWACFHWKSIWPYGLVCVCHCTRNVNGLFGLHGGKNIARCHRVSNVCKPFICAISGDSSRER